MKNRLIKITEYLFYLLIFLLPWQTRWIIQSGELNSGFWEYGSFSLFGTDILLLLIFLLFLISKQKKWQTNQSLNRLWPIIFAFLLINFFSILVALDKGLAVYGLAKLIEAILLFYLATNLRISLKKSTVVLAATAALQVGFALWQFIQQKVTAFKWLGLAEQLPAFPGVYVIENALGRFLRAYGSLHPIILANFLAIGFILSIALYLLAKKKWQSAFSLAALYLIILGLILTFSRVAWLSALLGLLFLTLMVWAGLSRSGRRSYLVLLLTIILAVSSFTFIYRDLISTRFQLSQRLEQVSLQERSFFLQDGVNLLKEHWYEGVGINNFTKAVHQEINYNREVYNYQPPNNLYLLIAAEASIFGLLIFFWLIWEIFRQIINKLNNLYLKKDFYLVVYSVAFIILLVTAFFDHTYWTLHFGILFFWLILGLWARSIET